MDAATEFDVGPLTWVKNEVDLALERADLALQSFSESAAGATSADLTQVTFCRTHLHQVKGALNIVGLDGVTRFAEAVEFLVEAVAQEKMPADAGAIALIRRALAAIRQYLDDLINGQPDQPLRLFALYREVQTMRGKERVSATDLFFPDLSGRPPRRETPVETLNPAELKKLLHQERARFQRGLLLWLKPPHAPAGVAEMLSAVRRIEATQEVASTRAFWWVAGGFLAALGDGGLQAEVSVKQLCARIDLQIRRLLEGSRNVAERLMRDTLYLVASADSKEQTVQQIKDAYRLQAIMPDAGSAPPAPLEKARRHLGELVAVAEESWSKFCAGATHALPLFRGHATAIADTVGQMGHTDLRRLAQATAAAANWVAEQPSRHSEAVAMEVATAIILTQSAQENFPRLGADFVHQVDVMVARLHGCLAQNPPPLGSEVPALDEMSRRAHEKLLIAQVAKEIQFNLAQIEPVLDSFFRGEGQRDDLAALDNSLHQVAGALAMMRHDGAVAVLRQCSADIKRFAAADYVPQEADFELVADRLSVIGFFVDSLAHGTSDFETFVRGMQPGAKSSVETENAEEVEDLEEAVVASVEQDFEVQKRETQALLEAIREQPDDASLRAELKHNLATLQKDADLVADKELVQQTKAVLRALETGADSAPHIDAAIANLAPQQPAVPTPSAETLQLSQASAEEIDAELLDIFLEEARDVLSVVDSKLKLLREQASNVEALTHLRRSFHTLKGSGRMVGLRDLGDVAWAVEQCLNLWLRQELAVAAPLLEMLDLASAVFLSWVEHLDGKAATAPDAGRLLALCLALRQSNESAQEIAAQIVTEAARPAATVAPSPVEATPQPSAEVIPFAPPPRSTEAPDFANKLAAELGSADEILELPDFDLPAIPASPAELEVSLEPICEAAPAVPVEPPEALAEVPVIEPLPQPETADFAEASAGSALEPPSLTELGSEPVTPVAPPGQPRISVSATLYEIFLEEAEVHLATLQRELGELEIDTSKSAHPEMRRAAHTLGGIAGTVGLMPINQLGLALEHALLRRSKLPDTVRAAQAAAGSSVESLETFGRAIAELGRMLGVLKVRGQPEEATSLIGALDALYASPFDEQLACESGGLTALEPAQVPVEAHKETPKVVSEEVRLEVHEKAHEDAHEAAPEEVPEAAPAAPAGVAAPAFAAPKVVDELDEQLLPIFLEEALDLNQKIAAKLRAWRSNPADGEVAHTLARLLHNLKGSARMAGAMQLGEITHAIESRVEETRRTGIAPLELIDEIDGAFDAISQIVDRLLRGESLEPTSALEDSAQNIAELVAKPEAGLAIAQAKRATPPAPAGEAGRESAAELATLRVRADLIDRLVNDAGELSIARSRIEGEMRGLKDSLLDLTENVIRLRRQMREIEIQAESQMQSRTAQTDEQHPGFDPLELDRFSRFQELTRMMSESVNDVGTVQQILLKNVDEANAAILAQARLNRELQQELMNVRMVPFISISDRLYRIVRQTAKELGKRANLEIKGGQLEIDRSVLDKMAAPLEHILRNAIAHGLETHETRSAQGKPDIGEIVLSLTQEGNQIVLSLSDDGAGLDFQRVRERAIAAGLLAPDQATDTAALVDLIFAPGLSTADELSQIAGRGVGLDVVKTEVTSLGGRIEVGSTPGVGTEFRLYIPLTLALTQALLVRAGSKVYAIPSVMIAQLLDLKEAALKLIKEAGEVEWMGQRYPFGYLPNLLGDPAAQPEVHRKSWVLLLRSGDQRIAVQIDEPRGNQEIVVKNIGPQLARVPGIDGATVLGNGQVVLILNPIALTRRLPTIAFAADASAAPETVTASAAVALVPTIMVVDDSLTVRKFTSRLLVREGYNVITAKDGVEALEHLVEVVPDVMLVDIEMPRMDGFDLTRNIRTDERLKDIPIIIITSRAAEKHRNYAFEIGVNQYLGKPYREDELLQLVGRYVKAQPKDAPVA